MALSKRCLALSENQPPAQRGDPPWQLSKELPDVEQGKFDAADGWRIGGINRRTVELAPVLVVIHT
jgi:hypothetical protein